MAENKKSIIEEALLDANRIQEALNSNAKEILRSVAKEEIDSLVKESLNEDDYEEEDVEDTDDLDLADAGEESGEDEAGEESEEDEAGEEEIGIDDIENDTEDDYEGETGMDDMEDSEEMSYDDEESTDDYETMDMTGASDEDVIAVYKKLSGDDEIEVVSDKEVHIKDPISGAEYQVKFGDDEPEGNEDIEINGYEESSEPMAEEGEEETVYEIAFDEEEVSENEELTEGEEFGKEIGKTADGNPRTATSDVTMGKDVSATNTGGIDNQTVPVDNETSGDNLEGGFDDEGPNDSGDAHAEHIMEDEVNEEDTVEEEEDTVDETGYVGGKVKRVATAHTNKKLEETVSESTKKYKALLAESKKLKKENEEFRTALKKFRKMLGETVVFNTNLTNVTRLFTEHSTTREEKEAIIARFDEEATTIKESKKLYKTIANELSNKKPISEAIENKISKEVNSSQSTGKLNESTAYVDASTQRIKDLISRVEKPRF